MPDRMNVLLKNATQNGAGEWFQWLGGRGTFFVSGTLGGATVTLQCRRDGGPALSVGDAAVFTAPGVCGFELPELTDIRAMVSGGTGASITAEATMSGGYGR